MAATELIKSALFGKSELKAYYRFESGAETTDSSGNSRTLVAISDPASTTGKFGNGIDLDATDAYSMTDHADVKPTGAFTLSMWGSKASATDCVGIGNYSDSGSKEWGISLGVTSGGVARLTSARNTGSVLNTDYKRCDGTTNICDSALHFIVGTWDLATMKIYVDGKLETSVAWANAPGYNATGQPRIGCVYYSGVNNYFWTGVIDDVALLNGVALTAEQIRELYEGRSIGELWPQANLQALYHLNGNSKDYSGNDNGGTDTAITYSRANGKFNQGAGLNGTTSIINLSSNSFKYTGSFTLMSWINFSTFAGTNGNNIFSNYIYTGNYYGYSFEVFTDGKLRSYIMDGSTGATIVRLDGTTVLSTSIWYHVALVRVSSTSSTFYLNGSADGSNSSAQNPVYTTTHYPTLGQRRYGAASYEAASTGKMDESVIFDTALTASAIKRIYANGAGKFY
jgi:hypothetical protein